MDLVEAATRDLPSGLPLAAGLYGAGGQLLAPRGYVLTEHELSRLRGGADKIFVQRHELSEFRRQARVGLGRALGTPTGLGDLAELVHRDAVRALTVTADGASAASVRPRAVEDVRQIDWHELPQALHSLLSSGGVPNFPGRLEALALAIEDLVTRFPRAAAFAWTHLAVREIERYSAYHATWTAMACFKAASVLGVSPEERRRAVLVALSANIGMLRLQDALAAQVSDLSTSQASEIQTHPERGAHRLRELGVTDAVWLDAVQRHHRQFEPVPIESMNAADRIARIVRTADVLGAKLSVRASRPAQDPKVAAKAIYRTQQQSDTVGLALLKAMGIYPAGTLVRLANHEVAVVLVQRSGYAPIVGVVIGREGLPTTALRVRDTDHSEYRIETGVSPNQVRVTLRLDHSLETIDRCALL